MRGKLISLLSPKMHSEVLTGRTNHEAALRYTEMIGQRVSPQLVNYWRRIFIDNDGRKSKLDASIRETRKIRVPSPLDDGQHATVQEIAHRILVIPDLHAPYHHPDALEFLRYVTAAYDPDITVCLGDETDGHGISFHDSDPNLDSAGVELEKAKEFLHKLHELIPVMRICHSNHGSLVYRRAKVAGLPAQMIKTYREILFPDRDASGWEWDYSFRIPTASGDVLFKHAASGPALADAAHNRANLVAGHLHGKFQIEYGASSACLYWAAQAGCLIDKDSMAYAYGKEHKYKPIIGCMVILDGLPLLVPMVLNSEGRWIGPRGEV